MIICLRCLIFFIGAPTKVISSLPADNFAFDNSYRKNVKLCADRRRWWIAASQRMLTFNDFRDVKPRLIPVAALYSQRWCLTLFESLAAFTKATRHVLRQQVFDGLLIVEKHKRWFDHTHPDLLYRQGLSRLLCFANWLEVESRSLDGWLSFKQRGLIFKQKHRRRLFWLVTLIKNKSTVDHSSWMFILKQHIMTGRANDLLNFNSAVIVLKCFSSILVEFGSAFFFHAI